CIPVLDHPLNHKHGRAPQLRLWGLQSNGDRDRPVLLVVGSGEVRYRSLLDYYHGLCAKVGPLPPPRVVNVDHGYQRFLLFALPAKKAGGPCVTPAFAWIDTPAKGARVGARFDVTGWAFKDGVGIERVEVLLDGRVVARARYGLPNPGTAAYWKVSTDPSHPDVGFRARVNLGASKSRRHWLGLRLHGRDGSVEDWSEIPVELDPALP
ncbi:MAG TPA: Ig-like domain-containing protein, partial [Pseudoxanthomonas sp.]|nr:Ig-like domain-containing protein [Pseudoxanthomonas sp.]